MIKSAVARLRSRAAHVRHVLADPRRKGPRHIARDVLALRQHGMTPRHYLNRLLFQRAAGDPAGYLSVAEEQALWAAKGKVAGWIRVYEDKTLFDDHYRRASEAEGGPFRLPVYLGQTRAGTLLRPGHGEVPLQDAQAFADALAEMVERSPTGRVFAKPAIANKGTGALLVRRDHTAEKAEEVRLAACAVDYVFQEALDQHAAMDRLHPGCLNTLRIVTGTSRDGSIPVLSVALRVGQGTKPVDNTHAGGLVAGVDRETGVLRPLVRTLYSFGAESYERHPETGVVFDGFEVPHFAEAVDLAQRAHRRLPLLYAGWDVGITPDGPVLIEGNPGPFLLMMEVANGGFKADPVVRAFLAEQGVVADGA